MELDESNRRSILLVCQSNHRGRLLVRAAGIRVEDRDGGIRNDEVVACVEPHVTCIERLFITFVSPGGYEWEIKAHRPLSRLRDCARASDSRNLRLEDIYTRGI